MPFLTDDARRILQEERALLTRLLDLLQETDAAAETVEQLQGMVEHHEALFLVVVVGEFNTGKSTALNALFGRRVMEEGPIPTTAKITVLRHGEEPLTQARTEFLEERRLPDDLLQHLTLVDTPGTNSIVKQHQKITEDFVPRSDLVLFVTSFDQPLTESERAFLSFIREDWGRRLVFVVNKADLAQSESDLKTVVDYVKTNCKDLLDFEPRVFPVSARTALRAKTDDAGAPVDDPDDEALAESGFADLESFIRDTLAGPEQVTLKLMAPLETTDRLLGNLEERLDERRDLLDDDEATLQHLREQIEEARTDLEGGYDAHLDDVEDVFRDVRRRGIQFLNDTIRVSRINLLRDREAFRRQFEDQVVSETTRQIEQVVTDAVDALLTRTMRLQQELFRTFADRVKDNRRERRFAADKGFAYDRKDVFESIMDDADRQIRSHDLRREVERIVENVYNDANIVVGAGVGAGAAGALGVILLISSALDVVGGFGLATGAAAALYGATVLPRQRRKAVDEFTDRIDTLRTRIQDALQERLDAEIDAALDRVWDTVQPFAAFLETERTAVNDADAARTALEEEVERLKETVRDLDGGED